MARTVIDIDEELLARSQEVLGTTTKKATVNAALMEVVRRAASRDFIELARAGGLKDVGDPDVMGDAWR
jgi:Arc/MetJ family transcription regulator